MSLSQLIGYARKSIDGRSVKLSIDATAFEKANRFSTQDGREYVQLVMNADKIVEIINGEREVTSICQIVNE